MPSRPARLSGAAPTPELVARARELLISYGVPAGELSELDVTVGRHAERRRFAGVRCHVCTRELPRNALISLGHGIFVSDAPLCLLQVADGAATWMELVELGFEFCGRYEMPLGGGAYRERPPLTSIADIARIAAEQRGAHGRRGLLRALPHIRCRTRSPMECAHVMMLSLPRSVGGGGIEGIATDTPIAVPQRFRNLTRRGHVVCDALHPAARIDFEYNGFHHDTPARRAEDEERRNVLEAMGYHVRVLARDAFFSPLGLSRHLSAVFRLLGIYPSRLPDGFSERQDRLRRFVLRRWLHPEASPYPGLLSDAPFREGEGGGVEDGMEAAR